MKTEKIKTYIHVDAQNLTTDKYYMKRSVRMSLMVRSKRE